MYTYLFWYVCLTLKKLKRAYIYMYVSVAQVNIAYVYHSLYVYSYTCTISSHLYHRQTPKKVA